MSGRQNERSTEALSRLPQLDLGELRELWCRLYKIEAAPRLSRDLLVRAVANRMQEVASGGPRLELQQTGRLRIHPELKPGTRLMRVWRDRSYEVLVLDDGFSWQGTHYRSLSAIARKITGTAWSGPLFFGLRSSRSGTHSPAQVSVPVTRPMEARNAAG